MTNITNGYLNRGGVPNSNGGAGNDNDIISSECGFLLKHTTQYTFYTMTFIFPLVICYILAIKTDL